MRTCLAVVMCVCFFVVRFFFLSGGRWFAMLRRGFGQSLVPPFDHACAPCQISTRTARFREKDGRCIERSTHLSYSASPTVPLLALFSFLLDFFVQVGVSDKCVMGLNQNHGMKILLRLRTDDLQGFRKVRSPPQLPKIYCRTAGDVFVQYSSRYLYHFPPLCLFLYQLRWHPYLQRCLVSVLPYIDFR